MFAADLLQFQPEVEARALPGCPDHCVAVDLAGQALGVFGCCQRDHRVGMGMVDLPGRYKGMQRGIDRRGTRIEVEGAMVVERHDRILDRRFGSTLRCMVIGLLQSAQLVHIQRREVLALGGTQVAARSFDPQHLDRLGGEWIGLGHLRRCIAATGIGDATV